jgi:hypothetical protein
VEGSFGSLPVGAAVATVGAAVATGMIGLAFVAAGSAAGLLGTILLRRSGSGWRVGRLLSAAPQRSLAEVAAIAARGEPAYVRVHGRVDSEEEFPSEDGKPIVFRRRRLQFHAGRSGWQTFEDERLAVPFGLAERGHRVGVDSEALGDGLVVVPRESVGVAADLTADAVSGTLPRLSPDTPVRLRIEQVSAVDHATAAGVPVMGEDGSVVLSAGLRRPLVLTTLELDEAMRVLASGRHRELLIGAGLLASAPLLVALGLVLLVLVR